MWCSLLYHWFNTWFHKYSVLICLYYLISNTHIKINGLNQNVSVCAGYQFTDVAASAAAAGCGTVVWWSACRFYTISASDECWNEEAVCEVDSRQECLPSRKPTMATSEGTEACQSKPWPISTGAQQDSTCYVPCTDSGAGCLLCDWIGWCSWCAYC